MIRTFECRSRRVITTVEGTEITKRYYLDPYTEQNTVLAALLGGVDFLDGEYTRRYPTYDTYMPWCYCVHAEVDQLSELQCSGGPTLGFNSRDSKDFADKFDEMAPTEEWGADFDNVRKALLTVETMPGANLEPLQASNLLDGRHVPHKGDSWEVDSSNTSNTTGCWITAKFRPIICTTGTVATGLPTQPTRTIGWGDDKVSPFDVVDPQLVPISKFVSVPHGLFFIINDNEIGLPIGQEALQAQAFATFTIRRLMCPSVPISTIAKLMGKTNVTWNQFGANFRFAPETMRFAGAEPTKRIVPNPNGTANVFWDILYKWDINLTYDQMYVSGRKFNFWPLGLLPIQKRIGYVGWNRVLLNFESSPGNEVAPLMYYRVGSKEGIWQAPFGFPGLETIRMQYPWAELPTLYTNGFGRLFDWDAA